MRPFLSVSPSQINSFNECKRLWWYQSVLGLQTPQRPSAALGTAVHDQLEAYMDKGTKPDENTEAGRIAKAGLHLLPEPGTAWTELKMHADDTQRLWPQISIAGVRVNGYIDLCDITGEVPLVLDHKTTSDKKYAKTREELLYDPQMILYGSFVLSACDTQEISAEAVEGGHVVYLTRGAPFAQKTTVTLTRQHLAAERKKLEGTVNEMKTLSLARSPDAVPGEPNSCDNYGGCHFRERCRASGLIGGPKTFADYFREAPVTNVNVTTTTSESSMSTVDPFAALKALKARNAATAAAAAAGTPPVVAEAPSEPVSTPAATVKVETVPVASSETSPVETKVETKVATTGDPDKAAARAALFAKYGIKAPEGTPAAVVAEKVLAAVAPEADAGENKTVRKPQKYAEKLAAIGWTEGQINRMNAGAMRAAIDGKLAGATFSVLNDGSIFEPGVGPVDTTVIPASEEVITVDTNAGAVVVNLPTAAEVAAVALPAAYAESGPRGAMPAPVAAPALTLYINAFPEKGRDRDYMLLEDVIAPLLPLAVEMHNRGAKDSEKADYYTLIPFVRGPGYVAMLLLKAPPTGVIVCNTRLPGTNACLEVLIPLADVVIRGSV